MPIEISEYRIAFFKIEVFDNLIPMNAPFGFLANSTDYKQAFADAQSGKGAFVLQTDTGRYWLYCLKVNSLRKADPNKVCDLLMPAFVSSFIKINLSAGLPARATLTGYCWPHCQAVVLNLFVEANQSLKEVVEQGISLRHKPHYSINPGSPDEFNLGKLLDLAMVKLHKITLGSESEPGMTGDLFSIVTFIKGIGVEPGIKFALNSQLHKALYGLSTWSPLWEAVELQNYDQTITPIKNKEIPGHVLCHSSHGRVVWLPGYFGPDFDELRPAGEYHSNLTTLTLQVESLGALVKQAAAKYAAKEVVSPFYEEYSRSAAVNLSLFYGGNQSVYRSASARDQIKENDLIPSINAVRHHFPIAGPDLA
jgi:hypothetical protein